MSSTGTTQYVREVATLDGLDVLKPLPRINNNIEGLLTFAHSLRESGLDLGPRIEKIEQVWEAAQNALPYSVAARVAAIDLDAVDPAEVAKVVTDASIAYTSRLRTSFLDAVQESGVTIVVDEFNRALTESAGRLLRDDADRLVSAMRTDFDAAVKVIKTADRNGLSKDTNEAELLTTGSSAAIAAYRGLPDAVAVLDRLADLRLEMVRFLGYETNLANPPHPVACFLTELNDEYHLEGAEHAWEGEVEHVAASGPWGGSSMHSIRRKRLGGGWLQLVNQGHRLHLNTAAEAARVVVFGEGVEG